MAGRLIGEAFISILPETAGFGPKVRADVKKALDAIHPTVNIDPSLNKAGIAKVEAELKGVTDNVAVGTQLDPASLAKIHTTLDTLLKNQTADIHAQIDPATLAAAKASLASLGNGVSSNFKLNTATAIGNLDKLMGTVSDLNVRLAGLRANVSDTAALAQVAALQVKTEALAKSLAKAAEAGADDFAPFEARMLAIQAAFEKISAAKISIADTTALSSLTALANQAQELRVNLSQLRASLNDADAVAKVAGLQAQVTSLSRSLVLAPASADLAPFEAQILGVTAAYNKLKDAQGQEDNELKNQTSLWGALGLAGPGSLIHITDILNASLPEAKLFGGAIGMIYTAVAGADKELPAFASHLVSVATSAHLTAEAAIEFTAIWGPALIALTAYALGATPTVTALAKQLDNMHIAATGTGQAFASLKTNGEGLVAAVKPSVLEAFGTALYAVQNHSSGLSSAMTTLGAGIDQFAAKAAVAFDSKAAGTFFQQASQDALGLFTSFQEVGSILGTLIKVVPGYAEVLLDFGNNALKAAADVTQFIEPALKIGIALHGALLYGGLAGTAVGLAFAKIASGAADAALKVATMATSVLGEDNAISKIALGAGGILEDLGSGPVIAGLALVTGAIAAIVIYLKASKDAASGFNSAIQQTIKNASLLALQGAINTGITATTVQYVAAQQQLVTVTKASTDAMAAGLQTGRGGEAQLLSNTGAVAKATATTAQYQRGLQQLTTEQSNVNSNLAEIAGAFGLQGSAQQKAAQALTLASGAQVTSNQLLATGAENTATLNAQIHGYVTMLAVVTPGVGGLNQALNVLNVTSSSQLGDIQKVTQAYGTWIGIVTGGDSAFTSFEEGQSTLSDELEKGSAAGVKLTTSSGKLTEQQKLLGTALLGTSTSALAARQAFDAQVTSATTLYGNLATLATVSGNTAEATHALGQSGKDLVAQLLPMAKGSQEATAEVFALAQMAGYTGVDSFQKLTQWVGNTKGAEADLDTQQTILTISSANLTQAAKNLNTALTNMVNSGEAAAIAKGANLSQIQDDLATSVDNSRGKVNNATTELAVSYYNALVKAGEANTQAKDDVDAFLTKLGATPAMVSTVNTALAKLPRDVNIEVNAKVAASGQVQVLEGVAANGATIVQNVLGELTFAASGAVVPGASSSVTHDNHLAMVKSGELIIPSQHAPKFADMARKASIPGFASGGPVSDAGTLATGLAKIVPTINNAVGTYSQSMIQSFEKTVASAGAAALASLTSVSGNVTAYEADVLQVMKMLNIPLGDLTAIMKQMQTESGGNPTAVNKTDINAQNGTPSTGLMQVIAGTFDAYAGPYRNTGPFLNGVSVNPVANIYAGLNYAIARYGIGNLTSVLGQGHGYSAGGMISEPVYGFGAHSGQPYSFAEHGPEQVIPGGAAAGGGGGMPGMTMHQAAEMIAVMKQQNKLLAQMPYSQAQAINQANAAGVRRGYFATSG